jgi:transcriptional regulator with XRE-family HTH domain
MFSARLCEAPVVDTLIRMPPASAPDPVLAATLRALRESQGRSQEAVAHDAGLTVAAFGRIERAQADPSWTSVTKIARVLGISLTELGRELDARRRSG